MKESWPGLHPSNNLFLVLQPDSSATESFSLLALIAYLDDCHSKNFYLLQLISLPASKGVKPSEVKLVVNWPYIRWNSPHLVSVFAIKYSPIVIESLILEADIII